MSAPAMKVLPSQISTTAFTALFSTACFMPCTVPSRTVWDSALTGGAFSVSTATSPSTVRLATAFMSPICASPSRYPDLNALRPRDSHERPTPHYGPLGAALLRCKDFRSADGWSGRQDQRREKEPK